MTKRKKTKRALLSSIVSLILCFSMLLGSTFAWFTDSASTGINTIQSGNLDIVVSYATPEDVVNGEIPEGNWKVVDEKTPVFNQNALWEPGYTEVVYFKIENKGSLALKYIMSANIDNEIEGINKEGNPFKLSEKLSAYYMTDDVPTIYTARDSAQTLGGWASMMPDLAPATLAEAVNMEMGKAKALSYEHTLEAGEVAYTTMAVFMPTTIGNEANHNGVNKPSIKLGINILATQYTSESDSYDDQYDAEATYPELPAKAWNGTADTSWYNDTDTEFEIDSAEDLAGLAKLVDDGNNFAGKTVKVTKDINLYVEDENGEPISFEPIGSFSDDVAFEGTFDGQGHTISNLYQNGWALANGYWDGPEYGMGLFSLVENAAIKNIKFDGASLPSEANIMGVVAGGAANCVFENINITDAYLGNHSWYSGGAIGWAEGEIKLINCDIDTNSVVSSQWGDFNNANGGLIGGIDPDSDIYLKDCDVACVIDAYNDVTSAYEWYSYRNCGMLIGDTGQKDDPDGNNVGDAIAPNLTCENVTVTYGNWANYHYCEFGSSSYPFCRVEAGESTGAYGNARVGEYFDANGNKVVDENHVHNDGEKHNELIVFDQLYGGETGDRYCTYGTATHDGVKVIYNNK